jgi:hypothetical protein
VRVVQILPAVSIVACLALGAGCASQIAGSGTGAGPRGGVSSTGAAPSGGSTSPSSPAKSSHAGKPSKSASGKHPVPAQPLQTKTVQASGGTTYVVKIWADTTQTNCAAHAYGAPVISFLRRHPCFNMRQLLATTTVDGKAVGFAQRTIGFRGGNASYRTAGEFRDLVTRSGTGNLNDLMREGYRLPSGPSAVPFPNAFSALGQDNSVTIVEAWYLNGPTPDNDPHLVRMAQDIFLQF